MYPLHGLPPLLDLQPPLWLLALLGLPTLVELQPLLELHPPDGLHPLPELHPLLGLLTLLERHPLLRLLLLLSPTLSQAPSTVARMMVKNCTCPCARSAQI